MNYLEQAVDALDAVVFSSDLLENPEHRKLLKEHCERWFRVLAEHEPLTAAEAQAQFVHYTDFASGSDMRVIDGMFSNEELMRIAYAAYQVKDV